MKKLALVLVLVAAIATAGFAQMTVEPSVSGSASVTFGVDLDAMATGLKNTSSANVTVKFADAETQEKGGDGTVYGWIELKEMTLQVDKYGVSWTAPTISARLYAGPIYINILGVNTADIDSAGIGGIIGTDVIAPANLNTAFVNEHNGFQVMYDSEMVDFSVFASSEYDWINDTTTTYNFSTATDSDGDGVVDYDELTPAGVDGTDGTQNIDNAYSFGTQIGISFMGIGANAYFMMGINYGQNPANAFASDLPVGFGFDVSYDLALGDVTLTPFAGFDGQYDVTLAYQVAAGFKLTWAELGTDAGKPALFQNSSVAASLDEASEVGYTTSGMSLAAQYDGDLDIKMGFYEDAGDAGLLPILGANMVVNVNDLIGGMNLGIAADISADLGMISPFAGTWVTINDPGTSLTAANATAAGDYVELFVGTHVNVIDNTTFTLKYGSGNLLTSTIGTITFATAISF